MLGQLQRSLFNVEMARAFRPLVKIITSPLVLEPQPPSPRCWAADFGGLVDREV
ncbi:MAG: hypothetical protein ACI9G5_001477 [Paracoccaceae bacterium]|jgi:hypothetical protein